MREVLVRECTECVLREHWVSLSNRQGPRLSIRLVIWILPSDTHSLVFISISHLSNLHISKQWDGKLCTLSLICRSLEWWRRKTDNSLRLQFHQVTEPPIGIFLNKRWTDSFEVSSFLWQGGIQGCTWLDQGASEIKWLEKIGGVKHIYFPKWISAFPRQSSNTGLEEKYNVRGHMAMCPQQFWWKVGRTIRWW